MQTDLLQIFQNNTKYPRNIHTTTFLSHEILQPIHRMKEKDSVEAIYDNANQNMRAIFYGTATFFL